MASRSTDGDVYPGDRDKIDPDTRSLSANMPQSPPLGYDDAPVDIARDIVSCPASLDEEGAGHETTRDKETTESETEDPEGYQVYGLLQAMPDEEISAELVTGSESTPYSETSYISFTMDKLFSGKLLI